MDIKYCFICDKLNFHGNALNCRDTISLIVDLLKYYAFDGNIHLPCSGNTIFGKIWYKKIKIVYYLNCVLCVTSAKWTIICRTKLIILFCLILLYVCLVYPWKQDVHVQFSIFKIDIISKQNINKLFFWYRSIFPRGYTFKKLDWSVITC